MYVQNVDFRNVNVTFGVFDSGIVNLELRKTVQNVTFTFWMRIERQKQAFDSGSSRMWTFPECEHFNSWSRIRRYRYHRSIIGAVRDDHIGGKYGIRVDYFGMYYLYYWCHPRANIPYVATMWRIYTYVLGCRRRMCTRYKLLYEYMKWTEFMGSDWSISCSIRAATSTYIADAFVKSTILERITLSSESRIVIENPFYTFLPESDAHILDVTFFTLSMGLRPDVAVL